jgi:hypothetical protein
MWDMFCPVLQFCRRKNKTKSMTFYLEIKVAMQDISMYVCIITSIDHNPFLGPIFLADNFIKATHQKTLICQHKLNAKRAQDDIFQTLKENNPQPRLVYPSKLSFIIEGKIKPYNNKQ